MLRLVCLTLLIVVGATALNPPVLRWPYDSTDPVVLFDQANLTARLHELQQHRDQPECLFVNFYAPWGGHCKHLASWWRDLATQRPGVVGVVDGTEAPQLAAEFDVIGYPSLLLFKTDGRNFTVERYNGDRTTASLLVWLDAQCPHGTEHAGPVVDE